MSAEFCADFYVQHFTEGAVRARGGALIAWRQLMMLDSVSGAYVQTSYWLPVMLQPHINPEYEQSLRLLDVPLFQSDIESFGDLERPPPETGDGTISASALGFDSYRMWGAQHRESYCVPTQRICPGDGISPPVGKVTDPDLGRANREEREHRRQQAMQLRAIKKQAVRYIDVGPDPVPIPYRRPNPLDTDTDEREARRAAA